MQIIKFIFVTTKYFVYLHFVNTNKHIVNTDL